jgi:hypothetical protein
MVESFFQIPPNSTGSKIRTEQRVVGANTVEMQYVRQDEPATFVAIADRIVPAVNKYILTLFNTTATRKVVLQKGFIFNWQTATVTGTVLDCEFRRVTARTAGATITPVAYDTADTLTAGITADSTTTAVTDSSLFQRVLATGEEVTTALTFASLQADAAHAMFYEKKDGMKGITCRQNQGVTIKNIVGTVGSISVVFVFTDEPV